MAIAAANIQFQELQFQQSTALGTWRWTTRMDLSGAAVVFEIRDIITPFGILRDSIPLPGEVVTCMAESITQLQANFQPTILLGPPADLTFTVTEGQGVSQPQSVSLTNNGVYGSLLNAILSTSASYVAVSPANIGNLASNESGSFEVTVDSTNLLNTGSPYAETITVQGDNATNTPQTYNITIIVLPQATIAVTPLTLNFTVSKPLTGPFPVVPTQMVTVENTGPAGSILDFQVQRLTNLSSLWLQGFSPVTGSLASGATQDVTVSVVPDESLAIGSYTETLRVSGFSSNSFVDVTVNLNIT